MATPIPTNHATFSASEVVAATGGALIGRDCVIRGVVTDSRAVRKGSLFVALRGDRFDGHGFVSQAVSAGAGAVVVAEDAGVGDAGAPTVVVADTTRALGDLAAHHRTRWGGRVVAITGSAGKTSTKELVAAALATDGVRVLKTHGNLNNLIGVPMMLLCLEDGTDVAVIEMGTNAPGEIARLAAIGRPDVALITLVSAAHTEGLGTLADVFREKTSLLDALGPEGVAVLNADDAKLAAVDLGARRVVFFGYAEGSDVRIDSVEVDESLRTRVRFEVKGVGVCEAELRLLGEAAARNSAAALAVVLAGGGDVEAAAGRLASVLPTSGRLCPTPGGPFCVIDDSYNANPHSTRMSLDVAREVARARGARLVAVLADMKELGAESRVAHAEIGAHAASIADGGVVFVGPEMEAAKEAAQRRLITDVAHVATAEEAIAPARRLARPGDVVLVKGSRSMATERVVEALTTEDAS